MAVLDITTSLLFIILCLVDHLYGSWTYVHCSGINGNRHVALPLLVTDMALPPLVQFICVCSNNNERAWRGELRQLKSISEF